MAILSRPQCVKCNLCCYWPPDRRLKREFVGGISPGIMKECVLLAGM